MGEVSFRAMGTLARAAWSGGEVDGGALADACAEIEARISRFLPDSDVSTLGEEWRVVSPHTARVLAAAMRLRQETRGYFDPLLGVGGDAEVSQTLARVSGPGRVRLDFGGIGKGYAADHLRDLALEAGAERVLVTLGTSSLALAGPHAIALASPWIGLERVGVLHVEGGAISVSADPGATPGAGRRRSHVIDPVSGEPALTDVVEVVVVHDDGMVAEAFSTALLAMGLNAALDTVRRRTDMEVAFLTTAGELIATSGLDLRLYPPARAFLDGAGR